MSLDNEQNLMIAKHHLNFDWPEILKLALDKFFGREYLVTVLMKITKE